MKKFFEDILAVYFRIYIHRLPWPVVWKATEKQRVRYKNALVRIANGGGVYGLQAHEYKQIAREALNGDD